MIGYYAHHQGSGHVMRAMTIAAELHDDVTILSSATRSPEWRGEWVELPLDTDLDPIPDPEPDDRDAGGALHFAPIGSTGLTSRMARISEWLHTARPTVVVVDVSVEVALLVRLHGVRVVVVAQPGDRTDAPHTLAYRMADAIIGCWPENAEPWRAERHAMDRVQAVGGLSRIPVSLDRTERRRQIAVLTGTGGRGLSALSRVVDDARRELPDFEWVELRDASPRVVAEVLRESLLVFAHCGANVVAEIAATRTPAVLVAEDRPFAEQEWAARALAALDVPVRVVEAGATVLRTTVLRTTLRTTVNWPAVVTELETARPESWAEWVDGGAASRAAAAIERVAALSQRASSDTPAPAPALAAVS